jgi:glycosyltransferase involved in cell wall biosynthesis
MAIARRISVFLPAYNEEGNLERSVADIVWAAERVTGEYEILIVNDGSTDRTGELAERLGDEAKLDHFSFLAADGEIARDSVRDIFAAVGRADIVVPYHQNPRARQFHRRFLTWASTALVNRLFGLRMHYYQGPGIYPVALARSLPKTAGGFYFLTQMLIHAIHAGSSYVEVGLTHVDRTHGRSKAVSIKNILKALRAIGQTWWAIHVRHELVARRT